MPTVTSMADAKAEADGLTSLDRVDVQLDSKRAGAFCHSVRHHKQKRYSPGFGIGAACQSTKKRRPKEAGRWKRLSQDLNAGPMSP